MPVFLALYGAATAQTASLDLLRRAMDPNPTLQSYTATAALDAVWNVVIPVHQTLTGTVYYRKPKRSIVFDNVPAPLRNFKELTSTTPTYEQSVAEYTITALADDAGVSTFSLVPKKTEGRVKSLTLTVDDSTALISRAVWSYTDGATLRLDETYTTVGSFRLPSEDAIAARFPAYSVDGTLRFSHYEPNAHVDPALFSKSP
ncbi:MAG: hypothetical protein M3Z41_00105 [Candidatus Eremiobacteraeota bacterium]|nr:hypothetical protein [Candidatus Eremiobacteraeota bacterium]